MERIESVSQTSFSTKSESMAQTTEVPTTLLNYRKDCSSKVVDEQNIL